MAHFPHKWATGRNGCNGLTGRNGPTGWMGAMGRLDGCNDTDKGVFHFLIQRFSACCRMEKHFFFVCSRPVWHKKLFHFHSRHQSVTSENRKVPFCATPVAPNGKKALFPFFNLLKIFERGSEMHLCLCYSIRPLSPLHPFRPVNPLHPFRTVSPLHPFLPFSPLHPFRPVAHLWGSGP